MQQGLYSIFGHAKPCAKVLVMDPNQLKPPHNLAICVIPGLLGFFLLVLVGKKGKGQPP